MSTPIFNLTDKTRVWAVRFVVLPNDSDFMGMVLQEADMPHPAARYRFRYYDAGPGFDAPDTKRIFQWRDERNDPKRLVAALDMAVVELSKEFSDVKLDVFKLDPNGEIGTSAMSVVEWIAKQPWASAKFSRKAGDT